MQQQSVLDALCSISGTWAALTSRQVFQIQFKVLSIKSWLTLGRIFEALPVSGNLCLSNQILAKWTCSIYHLTDLKDKFPLLYHLLCKLVSPEDKMDPTQLAFWKTLKVLFLQLQKSVESGVYFTIGICFIIKRSWINHMFLVINTFAVAISSCCWTGFLVLSYNILLTVLQGFEPWLHSFCATDIIDFLKIALSCMHRMEFPCLPLLNHIFLIF